MTRLAAPFAALLLSFPGQAFAHDAPVARALPTYEIAPPANPPANAPSITLRTLDAVSDAPVAARFTVSVDGHPWVPPALDRHGLRFTSIHTSKKQRATVLYTRGTGPVRFALPADGAEVEIVVTKGFEYLPRHIRFNLTGGAGSDPSRDFTARLERWIDLERLGWTAADAHLHYERRNPANDADWFTMLDGDGLRHGCFMVLQGGNLPGVWGDQFAYGKAGQARDEESGVFLTPGEEFRGRMQGHNNLFNQAKLMEPISVGGMGPVAVSENWPATHDVLVATRESGGIGGPAHGGTFGKAATAILDAVLGASEFFELANTHLYELQPWYRLLDAGFITAPVAGTDLPNFPYRGNWQPFFGEVRTYARTWRPEEGRSAPDFDAWAGAVRRGDTFITSGPIPVIDVDGVKTGERLELPGSTAVSVHAELASPLPITAFEIVRNGIPVEATLEKSRDDQGIHRWSLSAEIDVAESCWIAARGRGIRKNRLWAETGVLQHSMAHTAPIPVIVGGRQIGSRPAIEGLIAELETARAVYAAEGRFPDATARDHFLALFDKALATLRDRL